MRSFPGTSVQLGASAWLELRTPVGNPRQLTATSRIDA
jgi:hypothetical protein